MISPPQRGCLFVEQVETNREFVIAGVRHLQNLVGFAEPCCPPSFKEDKQWFIESTLTRVFKYKHDN
jgi:hypothetical protein